MVVAKLQGVSVWNFSTNFFLKDMSYRAHETLNMTVTARGLLCRKAVPYSQMSDVEQRMPEDVFEVDFEFWKHCEVASLKIDR